MRISINLATRPFVELRPLFARLRLAMAGLALLAVALGVGLHLLNVRAQAAKAQMDGLKAQTEALERERLTNEARMREPGNQAVLERSKFLNELFARKSFSWTAVMMDLENVLPGGVQVTSIEPVIKEDGQVNIRLRVNGQRESAVDLVRNLERSQRFLSPRLANETAQTPQESKLAPAAQAMVPGVVQFDILSGYNPLPLGLKTAAHKDEAAAGPASGHPRTAGGMAGAHAVANGHAAGITGRAGNGRKPGSAAASGRTKKTGVPGVVP